MHPEQTEQACLFELEELLEGGVDGHGVCRAPHVASVCSILGLHRYEHPSAAIRPGVWKVTEARRLEMPNAPQVFDNSPVLRGDVRIP